MVLPLQVRSRWLASALSLLCLQACYDHRVTQAIMERRSRAQAAEGAKIRAAGEKHAAKHVGRVRLHVSDAYRRQHTDWKETLLDTFDEANAVLVPAFGVRLEVESVANWTPRCDPADLDGCLSELTQLDPGAGTTWVVGVLGALPLFTVAFEELGRAQLPGTHLVLRDVSDLAERDAIDRAFPTHTADRREEIYRRRKRHKRLAVLLHEWAHTLGGQHAQESDALLFASYDDRMAEFDATNSERIARELERRFSAPASAPVAAAPERQQAAAAAMAPQASSGQPPACLAEADRAAYQEASQRAKREPADRAYAPLEPLVERYADCYAVQHLACALLMQIGRSDQVMTVCQRVQKLSASGAR